MVGEHVGAGVECLRMLGLVNLVAVLALLIFASAATESLQRNNMSGCKECK